MKSDAKLRSWFRYYNRRYFDGSLPGTAVVVWVPELTDESGACAGRTVFEPPTIQVNAALEGWDNLAKMVLLHEMVHLNLQKSKCGTVEFEKAMLKLAVSGAFKRLW